MPTYWQTQQERAANALGVDRTHAQRHYARLVDTLVTNGTRWLEIGCGHQILPDWAMPFDAQERMVSRCDFVAGIDVDSGMKANRLLSYRVWAIGEHLPFPNGTFTLATANMVVEHLSDPGAVLTEVNRVLTPGGRFLFHTVNQRSLMKAATFMPDSVKVKLAWWLERRVAEDVFPTHYRMNTEEDIRRLAAETGFVVERLQFATGVGFLGALGPLGVLEMPLVKVMQGEKLKPYGPNVMAVLRKTSDRT